MASLSASPATRGSDILSRLPREIIREITTHLAPRDLLAVARTSSALSGYFLHVLRQHDGDQGATSRLLTAARDRRHIPSLSAALAYNRMLKEDLLRPSDLVEAARIGDFDWVERMLFEGVSANTVCDGQTALSSVLRNADSAGGTRCPLLMVKLLVRHGAYIDSRGETAPPSVLVTIAPGAMEAPWELVLKAGRHRCMSHERPQEGSSCLHDLLSLMVVQEGISLHGVDKSTLIQQLLKLSVEDRAVAWNILASAEGSPLEEWEGEFSETEESTEDGGEGGAE